MARWYAVMVDGEDDWGAGSYCFDEAVIQAERCNGYIAVIEEGGDPICVEEIREFPKRPTLETWNDHNDGELMLHIDAMAEWDADAMDELILRADIYDPEAGIKERWNAEPDGKHDIYDFYQEACRIIREFHKRTGR